MQVGVSWLSLISVAQCHVSSQKNCHRFMAIQGPVAHQMSLSAACNVWLKLYPVCLLDWSFFGAVFWCKSALGWIVFDLCFQRVGRPFVVHRAWAVVNVLAVQVAPVVPAVVAHFPRSHFADSSNALTVATADRFSPKYAGSSDQEGSA